MKVAKPAIWVLLGVLIGGVGDTLGAQFVPRVPDFSPPVKPRPSRLVQFDAGGGWYFVKDSRSGGCWLAGYGESHVLAVAPPSACEPEPER
jgi:hypothetical protein